jgi:PAS domain S-box-containing protein
MAEVDVNAVLAVVVRELPGASVVVFDDRAQIVELAGPDAEELRERCGPLFERVLEGEDHSIDDRQGADTARRRIDVGPVRDANGRVAGGVCLTHRAEFPHSREAVDDALMRDERWDGQLRHRRKDGRQIIVSSRQALVRDGDGNPAAVIELNSDITDRVRGEQALRDAEQQFRGLMKSAPDAMVILDEDGSIVFVNVRAEEMFGYSRPEMIGQAVDILLPREFRERLLAQRMDFVTDTNGPDLGAGVDVLARRSDGTEFLAEISISPLQTDAGLLISTSIRDISKQLLRQLEQALVPRMKLDERWRVAWRYRPTVNTMLLGGDFIGVAERSDGSLSLLIGDVTGHGPAATGTGAMLRAAWLGAVQADVALESIPPMLDRLLVDQADREAGKMATVCLVVVDRGAQKLQIVRAGHDSPLLITRESVTALNRVHGPALGLGGPSTWPVRDVDVPADAAVMLFTDGTDALEDDLAVILLSLKET